jgi:hypothetical protein
MNIFNPDVDLPLQPHSHIKAMLLEQRVLLGFA